MASFAYFQNNYLVIISYWKKKLLLCFILIHQEHFYSLEKTEKRIPVHFNLNVWDNDLISKDDLLGMKLCTMHIKILT